MPKTVLLDYDITKVQDVGDFPSSPAILKAALGSGGDCLYIVKKGIKHTQQQQSIDLKMKNKILIWMFCCCSRGCFRYSQGT